MPHLHFENYTFNYYKYDYGQNWFNKLQLFTTIFENKIIFSPYAIKAQIYDSVNVLKQRGVEVEIDCNFTTPASYLISSPGNTERKKNLFPFSHLSESVSSICLPHRENLGVVCLYKCRNLANFIF